MLALLVADEVGLSYMLSIVMITMGLVPAIMSLPKIKKITNKER